MKKTNKFLLFWIISWLSIFGLSTNANYENFQNRLNNIFIQKNKEINKIYKNSYYYICKNENLFYNNLIKKINKLFFVPRYQKYKNLLQIIKNVSEKKASNCEIYIYKKNK